MALDAASLERACPEVEAAKVKAHLDRLPEAYLESIDQDTAAAHLAALATLSAKQPAVVTFDRRDDGRTACTIVGFDHRFLFSLLAGLLASAGFNIERGAIHTLAPPKGQSTTNRPGRRRPRRGKPSRDPFQAAVIIDVFVGEAEVEAAAFEAWSQQLTDAITETLLDLERGDDASVRRAKREVGERVTARLAAALDPVAPNLAPMDLKLDRLAERRLLLTLTAQDTPAYLYALATALSLRGISIDRVRIEPEPDSQRITDEIEMHLPRAVGEVNDQLLRQIELSALLTKQFTYYLDRSPDPFTAVTRFERLTDDMLEDTETARRWTAVLERGETMRDLARLLGTSDFLWEQSIRGRQDRLLDIFESREPGAPFAPSDPQWEDELEDQLRDAVGLAQQQDRVNQFKNDQLFLLDLDHILNPAVNYRALSERLTALAECVFGAAAELIYEDLARAHGEPGGKRRAAGEPGFALFGLGKLGATALGYASDVELMLVYDGDGGVKTAGGKHGALTVAEFYNTLVRELASFIHTRREGIFEVDLRLRPYGDAGPLSVSRDQFKHYYALDGEAHPFERMALVRLRPIAGDPQLGRAVVDLSHASVYADPDAFDIDALWDVWGRAKQEKLSKSCQPNAKYSHGALVDLEASIQLLQVINGRDHPELRLPRLSSALAALCDAGVTTDEEHEALRTAHDFYRRLINALRIIRGNAKDLFLPTDDPLEMRQLARRMEDGGPETAIASGEALMDWFEHHRAGVRAFIESKFGRSCPGAET